MAKTVTTLENITPALAEKYLNTMNGNRPLRQKSLDLYTRMMTGGRWEQYHPQGISFHKDGNLVDGQHRLWAISDSGVSVWMNVTRGLDDALVATLDQGQTRSFTDTAFFMGWDSTDPRSSAIAKIFVIGAANSGRKYDPALVQQWFEHYREGIDFALEIGNQIRAGKRQLPLHSLAALARASYVFKEDQLRRFAQILCSGQLDSQADLAAVTLRDAWLSGRLAGNRLDAYLKTEGAIRAFCDRRAIKTLQRPEAELFEVPKLPLALRPTGTDRSTKKPQRTTKAAAEARA